jgi:predicted MFS family arabinose efflux permease
MNHASSLNAPAVRHPWAAVIAVGLATFSVVTTEMLPVGLLTPIATALDSSPGTAALMISVPALLAAVLAPVVVLGAGRVDRRHILCALLGLLALANVACALAPDMAWMLAARALVGFCMGGIWVIAGGLAARLVPAASIGLATALIFGGVAAASVLGVPLGALIGGMAGWRWAFGGMAIVSALVLALHMIVLPALPVSHSTSLRHVAAQLRNRRLQIGLLLTLLLVGGHFAAFTFVRPLLVSGSGVAAEWVGALLFGCGLAGIAGNFLAGTVAARHTTRTIIAIALGLLLTPVLFLTLGGTPAGGGAALIAWGLAYGGVSVGLMTWMMRAAPHAMEIAAAFYVSVFNVGIALGAWTGGQLVDRHGITAVLWAVGTCAALAVVVALACRLTETRARVVS